MVTKSRASDGCGVAVAVFSSKLVAMHRLFAICYLPGPVSSEVTDEFNGARAESVGQRAIVCSITRGQAGQQLSRIAAREGKAGA